MNSKQQTNHVGFCAKAFGLASVLGVLLGATSASAFDYRASYVNVVESDGSGCHSPVLARLADGGKSVVLSMDNMAVLSGAGASREYGLATCQVKLDIGLPAGVQYTIKGFETLAHLDIERGGTAALQVRYNFPGTRQGIAGLAFQGTTNRDALLRRDFSYLNQYYSLCYSRRPVTVLVNLSSKSDSQQLAVADVTLLQRGHTIKLPLNIQECE